MSVHPAPARAPAPRAARPSWLDRLFLGGCTAAYVVLLGAVLVALRNYGG
jgi:hypothetical protein